MSLRNAEMLRFTLTSLLILLLPFIIEARDGKLNYIQKISIPEGLANNGATTIFEDSRGYIWIGTYDGLNRYDGYEIKLFKNTLDQDPLISSRIRSISEDAKGNLWIGTEEGISIYHYAHEKFEDLYANRIVGKGNLGPIVRKIIVDKEEGVIVCITEKEGVLIFNQEYELIHQYIPPKANFRSNFKLLDGVLLNKSHFLLSSTEGILSFDAQGGFFEKVLSKNIQLSTSITKLNDSTILSIPYAGISMIHLGKDKKGRVKYRYGGAIFRRWRFRTIHLDQENNLWLGKWIDGVIKIEDVESIIKKEDPKKEEFTIKDARLRVSCLASTAKGCWVGTYSNGVFRFNTQDNPFKTYNIGMKLEYGLQTNFITRITPFDNDRAYVLAASGGLGLFNTKLQQFETLPFHVNRFDLLRLQSVFVDAQKHIWLDFNKKGLCRVRPDSKEIERIEIEKYPLLKRFNLLFFAEDRYGNLWLRSNNDILKVEFDEARNIKKISSLSDNLYFRSNQLELIRGMFLDPLHDFLWVGTKNDGLYRIDYSNNKSLPETVVNNYTHEKGNKKAISSNFVTSIIRTSDGDLWVGTERGGVCKVINSDTEPEFYTISERDGLSNNVVKSIIADQLGNLWIPTNVGLNKYDCEEKTIRKLGVGDGLPYEDFLYASACLKNGTVMLSGSDGLCYFKASDFEEKEGLPKFEIEDLKVLNKSVYPGNTINGRVLIQERLNNTQQITLNHDENVFSLELKSLHFSSPKNYYYRYKLVPFDKEWIEMTTEQRHVVYSGLQPGEYTLKVSASNSIKKWTEPKEITIKIKPPFWKTIWAYLLYVLIIVVITVVVIAFITRIQTLDYKLKLEKVEKDNAKNISAAKLRFFSDISHEIRTPITLITGPIKQMLDRYKGNKELSEKLMLVKRQSQKISQLVDQVHDFQKADANMLKMEYSTFNFNTFVEHIVADFYHLSYQDNKVLKVEGDGETVVVSADRDKLEKVFNNLLNNAFKFTNPKDTIKVHYQTQENNLLITVSDTGRGIGQEDIPYIFERFYQSKNKQHVHAGGSGIGLAFSKRLIDMHYGFVEVESKLNEGTKFLIKLPIVVDEVVSEEEEKEVLHIEEVNESNKWDTNIAKTEDVKIEGNFSDVKIFLAEDNPDMRDFISSSLSSFFKVETFENGKQCIEAMEESWPDLLISDVLMPELNGLDLCKRVKSDVKTSHIPIILLTACIADEDRINGLKVGADAYIKKPFDMQHLVTRIETLLSNREQLRERFLLDLPLKMDKSTEGGNDHAFLEKLYSLIAENMDNQDLDIDNFAKELYLSRSLFYKKVKAVTNSTPYELLKNYRIKKAAEFLVQKKLTVNEVFAMTGFKSRTHFTKLFKEKYDLTPGKYAAATLKKYSK